MCEGSVMIGKKPVLSKTATRRLEERVLIRNQTGKNELKVDGEHAFLRGRAIQTNSWRSQSLDMGLRPDIYLEIAVLAKNESGKHPVRYKGNNYTVEMDGVIQSQYGPHRLVRSVKDYES